MNPLPDEVRAWLHRASADLLSARILVEHSPLVLGPAAFHHCQQAVEKTLKAFLVWRSVPFEKVHSLVYLMDCVRQKNRDSPLCGKRQRAWPLTPSKSVIRAMCQRFRWKRCARPLRRRRQYGILSLASYCASCGSRSPRGIGSERGNPVRPEQ